MDRERPQLPDFAIVRQQFVFLLLLQGRFADQLLNCARYALGHKTEIAISFHGHSFDCRTA
jgi:hypothetical protein